MATSGSRRVVPIHRRSDASPLVGVSPSFPSQTLRATANRLLLDQMATSGSRRALARSDALPLVGVSPSFPSQLLGATPMELLLDQMATSGSRSTLATRSDALL